jgi:hypothetical protein
MRWLDRMADVDPEDWNGLAEPRESPFLEWEWLWLMEASGSAVPRTGWTPRHLTVWRGRELIAAAPLYIKAHSEGEFVFDHAWADLAERLRVGYYPKLVGMSPFTPMIGYRFLTAAGFPQADLTAAMLAEIETLCRERGLSGASFLYADAGWAASLERAGYSAWVHPSFAWINPGYAGFGDYLSGFNANQRRNIIRERRALDRRGIRIDMVPGAEMPAGWLARMYAFYSRTNAKFGPWGCHYLTADFFARLKGRFSRRLVFAVARPEGGAGEPIGMSLLATKGDRLYGRYWGGQADVENLHFATCYYRPIEWAIERGIRRFDPGIGGGHKLRRGFRAVGNVSLHRFRDPLLRKVMERHIAEINRLTAEEIEAANREIPWRRAEP